MHYHRSEGGATVLRYALVIATLFAGHVAAQAPAAPRSIDPAVIIALLGPANSIAIEVPATAQHLHIAAIRGGEAIMTSDTPLTERRGDALTSAIAAGAITNANNCPVLLFISTGLEDAAGQRYSSSLRTLCLDESEGPIRRRPIPSPLQNLFSTHELKLDTWLALEAVGFVSDTEAGDDDLSGAIVFYLYLRTEGTGQAPEPPAFRTTEELVREQIGRPTD